MPSAEASRQLERIVSQLNALETFSEGRRPGGRDERAAAIRAAIAAAELPTLVSDDQGRYVAASDSACALTGYSCEQLVGRFVWDLTLGATRTEFEPLWRAFLSQGRQTGLYGLQCQDGRAIQVAYVARAHVVRGFHVSVLQPEGRAC
jgi:PAS domain S-box-containing protein